MLILIFDAAGKHLRTFGFDNIKPDDNLPDVELSTEETSVAVFDAEIITRLENEDVELQNEELTFTPKAPVVPDYAELRRQAYPPIGDQLDAIWKLLEPPVGTEAYEMKQRIQAVKERIPKP